MITVQQLENQAQSAAVNPSLLLGEIVQAVYLDALYRETESGSIHLQGGTSLRMLHQGWRYSEDLDFATMNVAADFLGMLLRKTYRTCTVSMAQLFGPETFRLDHSDLKLRGGLAVYWLKVTRVGQSAASCRVKIEFARYPVHRPKAMAVSRTDLPLPAIPLVMSQEPAELMADKLTALAGRRYLKGRDLFDIWFLAEVLKVRLESALVDQKFRDYRVEDAYGRLKMRGGTLEAGVLRGEMDRFLPEPYRSRLSQDNYEGVLASVRKTIGLLLEAR